MTAALQQVACRREDTAMAFRALLGQNEYILFFMLIFTQGFELSGTACRCDQQYFCNCSSNNLQQVPVIPSNTVDLDLSINQIEDIQKNDFSSFHELKSLNLQKNKLRFIHMDALKSQHNLEVLDLSSNLLKNLFSSWFLELKSLQHLYLNENPYTSLGPSRIFQPLSNLRTLKIGSPLLTKVYKNGLNALTDLDEIDLICSSLSTYEHGSLKTTHPIGSVFLSLGNKVEDDPELVKKILQDVSHPDTLLTLKGIKLNASAKPFKAVKDGGTKSLTFKSSSSTDEGITSFFEEMDGSPLSFFGLEDAHLIGQGFWDNASYTHYDNLQTGYIRNLNIEGFFRFTSMMKLGFLLKHFRKLSVINGTVFVIPRETTVLLRNLEYLDLSQNLLSDLTIQPTLFTGYGAYQNLNTLNVSQNFIKTLGLMSQLVTNLKNLINLDVSHNSFASMPENCTWPPTLRFLNLSNTKIHTLTSCLPSTLTVLDISENDLVVFNQPLPELTVLILTGNRLMILPDGQLFPKLNLLLIQRNALRMLNESSLRRFENLKNLEAGNNNFVCSCQFVSFFKDDAKHVITLRDDRSIYVCNTPFRLRNHAIDSVRLSIFECHMVPAVSVLCLVILIVLGLVVFTCHRLHIVWYMQMSIAWIKAKRKPAVSRLDEEICYDAFVSYSQHDAEWVEEILVPELESGQPTFSLCLHKRDFRPGRWIVDNIIDSIEKSYRTLFVLSESFVTSEWCRYELDFSHFRMVDEHNDSAVLVLLEPIHKETVPKRFCKLRKIMNSRTYLEWPEDEEKRSEFWSSLRAALQREE